MDTNSKQNSDQQKNKTSIKESAINKKEVDGRDLNKQQKNKSETHQPRDNA
nr:hypothetical protein [uncultured Psychroserpens sp.]